MLTMKPLKDVYQTGTQMERLTRSYHADMKMFDAHSLEQVFNFIKSLPYKADPQNIEFLSRPAFTIQNGAQYRDCDDKCIALGAYLYRKGVPFRFVAVSNFQGQPIHHVLIQAKINGRKRIIDATYPQNRLYHFKPILEFVPITKWINNDEQF